MPLPNSLLSYQDCLDFMDEAMADSKGARMHFKTYDQAERHRSRCHNARVLDRRQNERIYPKGEKMHGCSDYDLLEFTISEDTEGDWWVYSRKMILDPSRVEKLSEVEGDDNETAA